MKIVSICCLFFLFGSTGYAQGVQLFFNGKFKQVKERKAVYVSTHPFRKEGLEVLVLAPLEEGEKLLVYFDEGKFQRKEVYSPPKPPADSLSVYYHPADFDRKPRPLVKDTIPFEGTMNKGKPEVDPVPIGGLAVLHRYIDENLRYPKAALRAGLEGEVLLQFIVTADGQLDDIKVLKGISPSLDAEAVGVMHEFGKDIGWVPGRHNGIPVAVKMVMPVKLYFKK